jgi:UDP-N-acetylmuramate dehydrogenase
MMAAARLHSLIDRLPKVRGRYEADARLAKLTWFRVGGPAEVLFTPADEADLAQFLAEKPADVAVTVIGLGSNLLVRDGGVAGVVIRFPSGSAKIDVDGLEISAGAGAACLHVATAARDAGIAGMEFLVGIPGSIGGAFRMNAGAYGAEVKDIAVSARAVDAAGRFHDLSLTDLGFSYRHASVPEDWIFVSGRLKGRAGAKAAIARRMSEIQTEREQSQPLRTPTGGSTFRNPEGTRAWELIDRAGCRGFVRGGAMVSEKHCNFLINTGKATAADLEGLGEEVRRRVREATGITLEWEIRRIGEPSASGPREVRA